MTTARKIRLDLATPTEVAIRAAMAAVEGMGADVRLTEAGQHLQHALDAVASYVDEQMRGTVIGEHEAGMSRGATFNDWKEYANRLKSERAPG